MKRIASEARRRAVTGLQPQQRINNSDINNIGLARSAFRHCSANTFRPVKRNRAKSIALQRREGPIPDADAAAGRARCTAQHAYTHIRGLSLINGTGTRAVRRRRVTPVRKTTCTARAPSRL